MCVLGAAGTGLAYLWNFRNITPVVAVVLGMLFLGEALNLAAPSRRHPAGSKASSCG